MTVDDYLPLSFVISDVDGLDIILSGDAPAADELESGVVVPDDVLDGGVDGAMPELVDDGGVVGLIAELDDVEPVLDDGGGAVVDDDDDGDGVTTGGVVDFGVGVSRWQPASPNAMPVQSNVTRAALLIIISG